MTVSATAAMPSDPLPERTFDSVVVQDARRLYSLAFLILRDAGEAEEGGQGSSSSLGAAGADFFGPADEVMDEPLTLTVSAPVSSSWEILVYETNQPNGA